MVVMGEKLGLLYPNDGNLAQTNSRGVVVLTSLIIVFILHYKTV